MAEGIEEAENNSNSNAGDATSSMIVFSNIGSVKHEFETYQQTVYRSKSSPRCQSPSLPLPSNHNLNDPVNYQHTHHGLQQCQMSDSDRGIQSHPSPQAHPINLKSEVIVFIFCEIGAAANAVARNSNIRLRIDVRIFECMQLSFILAAPQFRRNHEIKS